MRPARLTVLARQGPVPYLLTGLVLVVAFNIWVCLSGVGIFSNRLLAAVAIIGTVGSALFVAVLRLRRRYRVLVAGSGWVASVSQTGRIGPKVDVTDLDRSQLSITIVPHANGKSWSVDLHHKRKKLVSGISYHPEIDLDGFAEWQRQAPDEVVQRLAIIEGDDVAGLLHALDNPETSEHVMNVFEIELKPELSTVVIHDVTDPNEVTEMEISRFRCLLQRYWDVAALDKSESGAD